MVCERPKCYRTKADKCMNPNSWILFLQRNAGKGLTLSQLKTQYKAWKSTRFPSNSTVTSRRNLLCDDISSTPLPTRSIKTTGTRKSKRDISGFVKWKKTTSKEFLDDMRKHLACLVKEDAKRIKEENRIIAAASESKKNRLNRTTILLNARIAKALSEKKKEEARSKRAAVKITKFIRVQTQRIKKNKADARKRKKSSEEKEEVKRRKKSSDAKLKRDLADAERSEGRQKRARRQSRAQSNVQSVSEVSSSVVHSVMVMEQRTAQLSSVRREQESIMKCEIPSTYGSGLVGSGSNSLFKNGSSFQGADSCSYIQQLFNMGDVRPTVLFVKPSPVYSIYTGVYKSKSVFIKVSSIKTEYAHRLYDYRVHIYNKLSKLFKGDSTVHISEMVGNNIVRVGTDELTGVDSVGSFESILTVPGSPVRSILVSGSTGDDVRVEMVRKLGVLMRSMHDKFAFHGDAHLANFIYNSAKKSIYPIDLERCTIFKSGDSRQIDRATDNDFSKVLYSLEYAMVSEDKYMPLMKEFCSAYYNAKKKDDGTFDFGGGQQRFLTYKRFFTPQKMFDTIMSPLLNDELRKMAYSPLFKFE